MKEGIHPEYFPQAVVVCACGNRFNVGSTKNEIRVEICSNCHPFFTGSEKFIDTEGRVERFQRRSSFKVEPKPKKIESTKELERPKSLREMLSQLEKE